MNKLELLQTIYFHATILEVARATQRAIESATDEETVPEHKYDTLALEASYLTWTGNACTGRRAKSGVMGQLKLPQQSERITLGSLVCLIDLEDKCRWFLLPLCRWFESQHSNRKSCWSRSIHLSALR